MHDSVITLWNCYLASIEGQSKSGTPYRAWHFCDNEKDADELAKLVVAGIKRATASSLWEYCEDDPLPKVGDLDIVTDWSGNARCVIRTSHVEVVPFCEVTPEFAAREGEGNGSMEYWRRVHWEYYERILRMLGKVPTLDMPIVCQEFDVEYRG